jgi:ELWxxDGT repeat protein
MLVFAASDGVDRRRLWKSDGSEAGTQPVAAAGAYDPAHLTVMNGALYFFARDDRGTSRWMRLPDLQAAPEALATLRPYDRQAGPEVRPDCLADIPVVMNGKIYFIGGNDQSPYQLWVCDGTVTGTMTFGRGR